jgi:N-acyl amino acid synthase FeeM
MKVLHPHPASDHPAAWSIQRTTQLSDFSKRVTCKLARSYVERDAIFKLRYRSYFRAGLISENSFGRYIEPADHVANAYLMGLYVDRRLVSSLRLQIGTPTNPTFSLELFPHVLEPLLRSNKTVVDMSCVAADGELSRPHVWLPYLFLRSWVLAAEHFRADYITAAMRPQHQIFYKRTLDCGLHSELRQPPHQLTTVGLVTLNFATSVERLYENLPFLRSTPSERQQLFKHGSTPSRVTGQHPPVS